ncbi:N-hydroxyarylamine O-acetyltransferase [Longispora fulva]|uniref:N-hydroxyarylamine O-acetyltransferase n=1 Tax=Longispora fulva TaxID=619741 RepID=A0A8J7GG43_9ACTN|nr:arylamine N-acetyltransferase [Longispora fulva]MBG6137216.1 N-hydroxyarylamine O-acetyltransferase [Longispora fulva]GIG61429.1 N-hydroxyarylamine O-acetyltransferase [Longispora fulva]
MDERQIDAYLHRIDAARPERVDGAALRELHVRHLRAVPFENLSIHLGEPISLDEDALYDKIVTRRRGGFCYELNGLFAALLTGLGFPVTLLAASVHGRDGLGPPFDHLALRVEADGPWLADVGFGRHSHYPLSLDFPGDQADPDGVFRLVPAAFGDTDVLRDGRGEYRLEARPRDLADFAPTCWWQQTSPDSHFTRSLVCSRLTDTGRVTLSGDTLIHTTGDDRVERVLSGGEVLDTYTREFGFALDRVPTVAAPVG